jgi:hypothetical protein
MENLATASLKEKRAKFIGLRRNVRRSLDSLKILESSYADQHRLLIQVYTDVIKIFDEGLA